MNRIFLIGNGFDLAKGLKSRYNDFIDWFWGNIIKDFNDREDPVFFENEFIRINVPANFFGALELEVTGYKTFKATLTGLRIEIEFKSNFFKEISEKSSSNWVDIEDEYFQELKRIIQDPIRDRSEKKIRKLNSDLEKIKLELRRYLTEKLNEFKFEKFSAKSIGEDFNLMDFTSEGIEQFETEYFPMTGDFARRAIFSNIKKNLDQNSYISCNTGIYPENVLFLNFNYTDIVSRIIQDIKHEDWYLGNWAKANVSDIYIHGKLDDPTNPIIFGYGDENDEIHNEIEKKGGEYLTNIKTINYLKTRNYKNLLKFLESGMYQIFILGHSCGLSDKTLLKTMFEHENCISIKPFYYTDEKGYNNYDDIVKNIYRTFSNKAAMRDKVVNKEFCQELSI